MADVVTAIVFINAEVARIQRGGRGGRRAARGLGGLLGHRALDLSRSSGSPVTSRWPGWSPTAQQGAGILRTETHIAFRAYSAHDLEAAFSLGG